MQWLRIDGERYCQLLEMEVHRPGEWNLVLDAAVHLDILDNRRFDMEMGGGNLVPFQATESAEDGLSMLGCPGPHPAKA